MKQGRALLGAQSQAVVAHRKAQPGHARIAPQQAQRQRHLAARAGVAQRMGGLIEFAGVAGGGTEFSFRLDLACAAAPPALACAAPGAGERVQLARLLDMLDAFSGDAGAYFELIRPTLAGLVEPHALARLSAHIAGYQFEDARRLLADQG